MENTPQSFRNATDSGCYFSSTLSVIGSTPVGDSEGTPVLISTSRKRKASHFDTPFRKFSEGIESCPTSPQFSSTLNESLMNNLERFHLQSDKSNVIADVIGEEIGEVNIRKISRCQYSQKFHSMPNTPEKQITSSSNLIRKANTNSFIKNFSQINVDSHSPLSKDSYQIIYPQLPPKKPATPRKFKDVFEKTATPAKKCLFSSSRKELFRRIVTNHVIMNVMFKYLSNGDLFRLSQVSNSLKEAILWNGEASNRYLSYLQDYHNQKENYKITPPSSPEKNENIESDPGLKNYQNFVEVARELNRSQSLVKCPSCNKPSVVENNIAYCQSVNSCGYIFCRKCNCFAHDPKDFKDRCNNLHSRHLLGDLSNSATSDYVTDTTSSFFSSSSLNFNVSSKYDSSGIFSECENSTPKQNVKRNLCRSFNVSSEAKVKILSSNNKIITTPVSRTTNRRKSHVPSLPTGAPKKVHQVIEPSSPPRIRQYSACSKQSKRNLKRLTR